jgi:hypothetical protein
MRKRYLAALIAPVALATAAALSPPARAADPVTTKIKAWNGQCLTIATADLFQEVVTAPCGSAHQWWWYSSAGTGTFRPSGHPDVAIGDSGGNAALVPSTNNGSLIGSDGSQQGPGGLYQRYFIAVLGANGHWHSNGLNTGITIQNACSNACFYSLQPS